MIEILLLCFYVLPVSLWVLIGALLQGIGRNPLAYSVDEMSGVFVSIGFLVWCVYLVRSLRKTTNIGYRLIVSYACLISIGSFIPAALFLMLLYNRNQGVSAWAYLVGLVIFILLPLVAVYRVWRRRSGPLTAPATQQT